MPVMTVKRSLRAPALIVGVIVTFVAGLGVSAAMGEKDEPAESGFVNGKWAEELPPLQYLENGKSYGSWRLEDPKEKRPQYVEVELADGTKGFVAFAHLYGDPPQSTAKAQALSPAELARSNPGIGLKANGKGELWAPVVDRTGEKVIGQYPVAASTQPVPAVE